MKSSSYFWIIPFLSFMTGYYLVRSLCTAPSLNAPSFIGKDLPNALKIASDNNLNIRVLSEKDDLDLPPGTILSQTPRAGSLIKPHQSIFLLLTKKPQKMTLPSFIHKTKPEIEEDVKKIGVQAKFYPIESAYPQQTCIGQFPAPGTLLHKDVCITVYQAINSTKPFLLPNFTHKPVNEVLDFLSPYGLQPAIIHQSEQPLDHRCDRCIVTHQRPLPGSLITLNDEKPLLIQLQAAP